MFYRNRRIARSFGCPLKLTALLNCITVSTLSFFRLFDLFSFCRFSSSIEFCSTRTFYKKSVTKMKVLPMLWKVLVFVDDFYTVCDSITYIEQSKSSNRINKSMWHQYDRRLLHYYTGKLYSNIRDGWW